MIREVFGVAIESATCDWLASRYAAVEPSLAHQHTYINLLSHIISNYLNQTAHDLIILY
jgi:hypothetical protein